MKKACRQSIAAVLFFCGLALVLLGLWQVHRAAAEPGEKSVTAQAIHSDGTSVSSSYQTDLEYLEELLVQEGLVSGTQSEYGLFVDTVDGETAVTAELTFAIR